MKYNSPFLSLDELERDREKSFGAAVDKAANTFGNIPLTLENLRRSDEDRQAKLGKDKQDAALADQRLEAGTTKATNDAADRKQALLDRAVAAHVGAGVGQHLTREKVVGTSFDNPDLGELTNSNDVEAEYTKQDLARQKSEADIDAKKATANVKPGNLVARQAAQELSAKLLALREKKLINDDEYHDALIHLGNVRAGIAGDDLTLKKDKFTREVSRQEKSDPLELERKRLSTTRDLSSKEREQFADITSSIDRIDNLIALKRSSGVDSGPLAGLGSLIRRKIHMQGADDATIRAATADIGNELISKFAGKAVTAAELARVMETIASMWDEDEIFEVLMNGLKTKLVEKNNAMVDTLSSMPGRAWVSGAQPKRDKAGKAETPRVNAAPGATGAPQASPPQAPPTQPAPAPPGFTRMNTPKGVKLVPNEKVDEAIKRGAFPI